jgi:cell pole-organizing protein PopZ
MAESLAMGQPAKVQEPSMEEILASIRRIIADDDNAKPEVKPATKPVADFVPPPAVAAAPVAPVSRPAAAPPPKPDPQQGVDAMLARLDPQPRAGERGDPQDVLDLTEQMEAPAEAESPAFRTIDGQSDVIFTDTPVPPEPRASAEPKRAAAPPPPAADRSLMSSSTSAAVDSAFNALAQTVLVQNARTLEDLVREMLRPMLKSWLDDNLPSLVERIVKAEIERVSRGRG